MLTFITPSALLAFVAQAGGQVDKAQAEAFLEKHQTLEVHSQESTEGITLDGREKEEYGMLVRSFQLGMDFNNEEQTLALTLTANDESGENAKILLDVARGGPRLVVSDNYGLTAPNYELSVYPSSEGVFVSCSEPFTGGRLADLPHDSDVGSPLMKYTLLETFKYKEGHYLAGENMTVPVSKMD